MYLIFETEQQAIYRADEEGLFRGYSFFDNGLGTRWLTAPQPTADDMWALDVSEYALDLEEEDLVVDSYPHPPLDVDPV